MEIVYRKTSELVPYANNARTHTDEQVAHICASIREYGWTNPVLIDDDGTIIAGHGRVRAAVRLSIEDVPCIVLTGLTKAQKKAYVIADNKMALNAGWEEEKLRLELDGLNELDFDLSLTGFSDEEMKYVLDPFGGSGSTMIACELLGSRCLSMEYDPRYADVIVRRWEKMTGKKATREESDGKRRG